MNAVKSFPTIYQDTISDVKFQDIIYYKYDKDNVVDSKDHIHIDFLKAMSEMEKLDWTLSKNYIGFENCKTDQLVQFIRIDKNRWYTDVPIYVDGKWSGYYWASEGNNYTISNMLRLFFEEMPWFGMLNWRMRKYNG